jgi:hypothetical protein
MHKEITIEHGFQVVMLFLRDLWCNFLKDVMIKKGIINKDCSMDFIESNFWTVRGRDDEPIDNVIHRHNDFFFIIVCDGTADKYFEEVIEQRMHIPPIKQHDGLLVDEQMLFQLTMDFCEYFNRRFQKEGKDSLRFAIEWLEDMRKHAENHEVEWEIWNQIVIDVTEHGKKFSGFF